MMEACRTLRRKSSTMLGSLMAVISVRRAVRLGRGQQWIRPAKVGASAEVDDVLLAEIWSSHLWCTDPSTMRARSHVR